MSDNNILTGFLQGKSSDKPALEEYAFETLERDFQEVILILVPKNFMTAHFFTNYMNGLTIK